MFSTQCVDTVLVKCLFAACTHNSSPLFKRSLNSCVCNHDCSDLFLYVDALKVILSAFDVMMISIFSVFIFCLSVLTIASFSFTVFISIFIFGLSVVTIGPFQRACLIPKLVL